MTHFRAASELEGQVNMQVSHDHHYVPQFLINRWFDSSQTIHWYWWPRDKVVMSAKKSSKHIGYLYDLNATPMFSPREPDEIEAFFNTRIEAPASKVTSRIMERCNLTLVDREVLIDYVLTSGIRSPAEMIRQAKYYIDGAKLDIYPDTGKSAFEKLCELDTTGGFSVYQFVAHGYAKSVLNSAELRSSYRDAHWATVFIPAGKSLLLSDVPIAPMGKFVAYPISPKVYIAVSKFCELTQEVLEEVTTDQINQKLAETAEYQIFSDHPLSQTWIEKHLDLKPWITQLPPLW